MEERTEETLIPAYQKLFSLLKRYELWSQDSDFDSFMKVATPEILRDLVLRRAVYVSESNSGGYYNIFVQMQYDSYKERGRSSSEALLNVLTKTLFGERLALEISRVYIEQLWSLHSAGIEI